MSSAQANLAFQVEMQTRVDAGKAAQDVPSDAMSSMDVILADRYFTVSSAKRATVCDFDKRKRVMIDAGRLTSTTVDIKCVQPDGRPRIDGNAFPRRKTSDSTGPVDRTSDRVVAITATELAALIQNDESG
jgi:hypothetical protein